MSGDEFACILHRTILTPLHNSATKTVVPPKCISLTRDKWESIITTLRDASRLKTMTPQSIKTLSTNSPQICQIMEVTKCFAAFIDISKDLLCYTAQPKPTASDQKCNHILQNDIKETVVNKSTTRVFEKKCPFCKESQRKVNQTQQPLISCPLESCEDFMKNIKTNSDD